MNKSIARIFVEGIALSYFANVSWIALAQFFLSTEPERSLRVEGNYTFVALAIFGVTAYFLNAKLGVALLFYFSTIYDYYYL